MFAVRAVVWDHLFVGVYFRNHSLCSFAFCSLIGVNNSHPVFFCSRLHQSMVLVGSVINFVVAYV